MRPLSVVSDLKEAIGNICDEAHIAGLDPDIILSVINEEVQKWMEAAESNFEAPTVRGEVV